MNTSELLFIVIPPAWFLAERFVFKRPLLSPRHWLILLAACLALSVFLTFQLSRMTGGRWLWPEIIYYGWFLFSLFVIVQIIKKIVSSSLEAINQHVFHQRLPKWSIKTFYFVIMFITIIPFFLAMTSMHRIKVGDRFNPQNMLGLEFENITLHTSDHLVLSGWFVPAASDRAVIIAHGLGANKSNFMFTVGLWNRLGFNVLIFDFRGHGESDGHTVSFGYKERLDVIAAMKYLVDEKKFQKENIWGYGVSFGGAAMILAEEEVRMFRELIIDSSFANLDTMAQAIVEQQIVVPRLCSSMVKTIGLFFVKLDLGFDIREHSPERVVGRLNVPILLIHGQGDPLIPWQETQKLYDRARYPKQVVLLNTSGHFGTLMDPGYIHMIKDFVSNIK